MLVVDAGALFEVVAATPAASSISDVFIEHEELAAPHVVDVEVFGVIRAHRLRDELDETAAAQAVDDLKDWPGERYGHRLLLDRAWELRTTVRGWDAMYVALAEVLDAPLLTTDRRLSRATGPRCRFVLAN